MLRTVKDLRSGECGWVMIREVLENSMMITVWAMTDGRVFVLNSSFAYRHPPAWAKFGCVSVRRNDAGDLEMLIGKDQEFMAPHENEPDKDFSKITNIIKGYR
jgi:hypothetical protein